MDIMQKDGMYVPAQSKVRPVVHHLELAELVMLVQTVCSKD